MPGVKLAGPVHTVATTQITTPKPYSEVGLTGANGKGLGSLALFSRAVGAGVVHGIGTLGITDDSGGWSTSSPDGSGCDCGPTCVCVSPSVEASSARSGRARYCVR